MIQIKQKHYLSKTQVLKLFYQQKKHNHHKKMIFQKAYRKWKKSLEKILDLTNEIKGFNEFYSKYITTIMICFGIIGCYILIAITMNADDAQFIFYMPWVIYGWVYLFIIFLFNAFSSRTIYLNVRLFKAIRQVQIRLLSERYLSFKQIIKLDLVNEYKILLQKCSFRLSNSAQMNSKLFAFQIFGYVSFFYMKLVKEGRNEGLL